VKTVRAPRTLCLAELYAPAARDLEQADRIFRDELATAQPVVRELCRHVEHFRGKQLRPAALLLSARACGEVCPEHHVLAAVVEMVHIATLVHDDVLDEGELRRRTATVNHRWGNGRAVLLGDLLFSHAYHLCSSLADQDAACMIAHTAITVCAGELEQIANRGNHELTEEEYLDIIARKTAALLGASTLLGARYAGADEHTCRRMQEFGTSLGIAFQITDDLLDLIGDESEAGKSLGRDVAKGELTLPLIHFLRESGTAERAELRAALRSGGAQRALRIARLLEGSESVAYTRRMAHGHVEHALQLLFELPPSEARQSLSAMAEFVLARRY
jgi:octaprenyl-diphosphate synthase